MGTLLQSCLVLHITGIVLLAGTIFGNYIISRKFWSYIKVDKGKAMVVHSVALTLGRITGIGGAVILLTGIGMVAILHGAVGAQLWFRVKMILVLLIILNLLLFARPQNRKLKKILSAGDHINNELGTIRPRMDLYYMIQLILLFSIFVLSVFRFA